MSAESKVAQFQKELEGIFPCECRIGNPLCPRHSASYFAKVMNVYFKLHPEPVDNMVQEVKPIKL